MVPGLQGMRLGGASTLTGWNSQVGRALVRAGLEGQTVCCGRGCEEG